MTNGTEQTLFTQDIVYKVPGDRAVLLLHGLRSSPLELAYLAKCLAQSGVSVFAPYIEGYAVGSPCTSFDAWITTVERHYATLRRSHAHVAVAGLCMGATLALALTARQPDVSALALLSITLDYDGWNIPWYHYLLDIAYYTPLRNHYSLKETAPYGLKNEALRKRVAKTMSRRGVSEVGAERISMRHIYEARQLARHVKRALHRITTSALVIHAIDDDTASVANANRVFNTIPASFKRKIFLDDSYHIITMDNERALVAEETCCFFEEAWDLLHQEMPRTAVSANLTTL
jgi:carboxylesterase